MLSWWCVAGAGWLSWGGLVGNCGFSKESGHKFDGGWFGFCLGGVGVVWDHGGLGCGHCLLLSELATRAIKKKKFVVV